MGCEIECNMEVAHDTKNYTQAFFCGSTNVYTDES